MEKDRITGNISSMTPWCDPLNSQDSSFPWEDLLPLRVVLLDDDPLYGKIMDHIAGNSQITLSCMTSLANFFRHQGEGFGLALVDYDLGNISGIQVAQILRKYGYPMPVVLISSYSKIKDQSLPDNIIDFISKSRGPYHILDQALMAYYHWQLNR